VRDGEASRARGAGETVDLRRGATGTGSRRHHIRWISSTGVVSGTPTALGTFPFEVSVADAETPPASVEKSLAIHVGDGQGVAAGAAEAAAAAGAAV
jgi:hypothetical protein